MRCLVVVVLCALAVVGYAEPRSGVAPAPPEVQVVRSRSPLPRRCRREVPKSACDGVPIGGLVPYPSDCNLFLYCGVWWRPLCRACPRGLHFNRDLSLCDYPDQAGCQPPLTTSVPTEGQSTTEGPSISEGPISTESPSDTEGPSSTDASSSDEPLILSTPAELSTENQSQEISTDVPTTTFQILYR